jgi:hypothetical protein
MLAASLAFEKNCVLLRDAAVMSICRYLANGPYAMVLPVLRGTKASKNFFGISLLALLSLSAILSQFLSTMLLSDTGLVHIAGKSKSVPLKYRHDHNYVMPIPTMSHRPAEFPRFADRAATYVSISDNLTAAGSGISDTGPTLRALIPLSSSERSSLLYYQGKAAIVDSHVICTSPTLDQLDYDDVSNPGLLSGNLSTPFLKQAFTTGYLQAFRDDAEKALSYNFTFKSCMNDGVDIFCPVSQVPSQGDLRRGYLSRWWLLAHINRSKHHPNISLHDENLELSRLIKGKEYRFNGDEWTSKSTPAAGGGELTIDITLCGVAFDFGYATIEVKADKYATEPSYPIFDQSAYYYHTDILRNQAGVKLHDNQERGIFNLTHFQMNQETDPLLFPADHQWNVSYGSGQATGVFATSTMSAHNLYDSIFKQTLAETNKPALAIQAIFTVLSANIYYAFLDCYNVSDISTVQTVQPVIIPITKRGLFIVYGIIGLHFLTVGVVFGLYFNSGIPKFLDQAWQTVSQIRCGDASEFLDDASNLGDQAVQKLPAAAAKWEEFVGISVEKKPATINCETTSYSPQQLKGIYQTSLFSNDIANLSDRRYGSYSNTSQAEMRRYSSSGT